MQDEIQHILPDETVTLELAKQLSQLVGAGELIALSGDLGAGKSTFARAFIRTLLGDPEAEVPSPTFTLVQEYDHPGGFPVYHADLYRLDPGDDIEDLGLDDERDAALMLIEWPDRLPRDWHSRILELSFELRKQGSGQRTVKICFDKSMWAERIAQIDLLRTSS